MRDAIAVLNGGSSSINFSVYEIGEGGDLSPAVRGHIEGIGVGDPHRRGADDRPPHRGHPRGAAERRGIAVNGSDGGERFPL